MGSRPIIQVVGSIRAAREDDLTWILRELRKFNREVSIDHSFMPDDSDTRIDILRALIKHHCFFVDEEKKAFVAGTLSKHLFNPDLVMLDECFWWVNPEMRGSSAAFRLLQEYVHYGHAMADLIFFSLQRDTKVKEKHLLKHGFRLQEKKYLLEV